MIPQKKLSKYALVLFSCIAAACDNTPKNTNTESAAPASNSAAEVPAAISYNIVNQYPHDAKAFTEGLEFHEGVLYESTGEYGVSDLRKVDLTTGKVLQTTKMEPHYFGEGLTILNGKIYQLTYREGKCFVYDQKTMKQESSFPIQMQEGWGMTNDGTHLIIDDGGNVLYFIDPKTFAVVKQLTVTDEYGPVKQINELELIKGYIYANVWKADVILKIDATTGKVVARADLSTLRQQTGIPQPAGRRGEPEVLNGIAYDAVTNRIFITGKNWPKLFEVKLDN